MLLRPLSSKRSDCDHLSRQKGRLTRRLEISLLPVLLLLSGFLLTRPRPALADYVVGHIYLTNQPGSPYDATASYTGGHVIDEDNNLIYITIVNSTVYDNANNANIGFVARGVE